MDPAPSPQALTPTLATTVDELIKAAFFVATSIDVPVVEVVSQHLINIHYALDGSLVSLKVEGRPGAWGGIGPKSTLPEEDVERNAHYDAELAAATPPPPEGAARKEDKKEEKKHREYSEPKTW